jgi:hypothetical protein
MQLSCLKGLRNISFIFCVAALIFLRCVSHRTLLVSFLNPGYSTSFYVLPPLLIGIIGTCVNIPSRWDTGRKKLHQRVTRCILIWLVGIMKLHSVGLQSPGALSGEHPKCSQPAGFNFIHPIISVRHGPRLKPGGPNFLQPWSPGLLLPKKANSSVPPLRKYIVEAGVASIPEKNLVNHVKVRSRILNLLYQNTFPFFLVVLKLLQGLYCFCGALTDVYALLAVGFH